MKIYVFNEMTCTRVKLYGIDVTNLFLINGCHMTKNINKADLIIINTCSFLKSKEIYFIDFIKKINANLKEGQKIAIIGCLPSINSKAILDINPNMILFRRDIKAIKEYFKFKKDILTRTTCVKDKLPFNKKMLYLFNKLILHSKHLEYRLKRSKVCYLQISTGCCGKCTYCSEKFTTVLKSRSIDEIIEAIYDGINRGFTLFGLNSDDASAYGIDRGASLEKLLGEIIKLKEDINFTIPEFNPNGLTDKIIEYLGDNKFLYITVPIQSGSQRILDLMKRPYRIDEVKEKLMKIRNNNPKLMINTHVIVGFPGETEEDFAQTKEILQTGLFDRVKVFMYNERPNTEALKLDNKIPDEIKKQREQILLKTVKQNNLKKKSLTNLILNMEQIK